MDQKLGVPGIIGLATAAICGAIMLWMRTKNAGASSTSSRFKTEADQGATASNRLLDEDEPEGSHGDDQAKGVSAGGATGGGGAAGSGAPVAPGAATARGGGDGGGGAEGGSAPEEDTEALILRFNKANSIARKFFAGQRYALAAEHYGIALKLCDDLPHHDDKRTALHNNRGAAYEKDGQYALSLADCSICLAREVGHKFARLRKSRVLEALGKDEDALSEVCAHLLLERDRVQAKAALTPSEPLAPPAPPANLEGLLRKVALKRAEEILAEREEAAATAAGGGKGAGTVKRKPLLKQAATELMRSFGSFRQLERRYKGMQETAVTRELKAAEDALHGEDGSASLPTAAAAAAAAAKVSSLLDRGMLRLLKRNYDGSREDIFEAAELLSTLTEAGAPSAGGISADVQASVWEWQGTYLQLAGGAEGLDEAMKAYERCGKVLEAEGEPYPADCLIKMAWVSMDKEDTEGAKAFFERAMENHPGYGTSYAHRARLGADGESEETVTGFLEKAIELDDKNVFAWEQLCRLHVQPRWASSGVGVGVG